MIPFNLEEFKAGKPAYTKDGSEIRFIQVWSGSNDRLIGGVVTERGLISRFWTLRGTDPEGRSTWDLASDWSGCWCELCPHPLCAMNHGGPGLRGSDGPDICLSETQGIRYPLGHIGKFGLTTDPLRNDHIALANILVDNYNSKINSFSSDKENQEFADTMNKRINAILRGVRPCREGKCNFTGAGCCMDATGPQIVHCTDGPVGPDKVRFDEPVYLGVTGPGKPGDTSSGQYLSFWINIYEEPNGKLWTFGQFSSKENAELFPVVLGHKLVETRKVCLWVSDKTKNA